MNIRRRALRILLRQMNTASSRYYTYKARPKRASEIGLWSDAAARNDGFAVVMQGPVHEQDDFTLESLRIYRKLMPGCSLILSTWEDTAETLLDPIRREGVEVITSPKPDYPGILNINMLLESARAGVDHAVASGANWIIKTRTDQRMCAPNLPSFLIGMAQAFPVNGDWPQKCRIFGLGMGSLKYGLYHLTDQSLFGSADDMKLYWSPPMRVTQPDPGWPSEPAERFSQVPIRDLFRNAAPETYFASQYLVALGRSLKWTVADSWAAFRDHFGVVDFSATDFYWVKNQGSTLLEDDRRYQTIDNRLTLDFKEWLLLFTGALTPEYARHLEPSLDTSFYDAMPQPDAG